MVSSAPTSSRAQRFDRSPIASSPRPARTSGGTTTFSASKPRSLKMGIRWSTISGYSLPGGVTVSKPTRSLRSSSISGVPASRHR